jgi:hypothetical protein
MLMRVLLVRKNLWEVVDGSLPLPQGGPNTKPVRSYRKKQAEAVAEIILHVEVAQLSFIQDDDPEVVWDALSAIHQARGMASRIALRRRFLRLTKPEGPMQNFIAEARRLALQLQEIGVTVDDEDIILVLTGGLPKSYDNFVITLDATPSDQLTLDYVVTRLLNEESRQIGTATLNEESRQVDTTAPQETSLAAYARHTGKRDLSQITCFKCGKKGHFQTNCPDPDVGAAAMTIEDDEEDGEVFAF